VTIGHDTPDVPHVGSTLTQL